MTVASLERYKKDIVKSNREKFTEKHSNVGKNNRLGEILEFMNASDGWATIKTISEKFGWTDQQTACKMSYYVSNGYMQVSDRIKTRAHPLSVYTITDKGDHILGNYLARHGSC